MENQSLHQKVDRLTAQVAQLALMIGTVAEGQAELRRDFSGLAEGQAELRRDFSNLAEGQAELRQEVTGLAAGQELFRGEQEKMRGEMKAMQRAVFELLDGQKLLRAAQNDILEKIDIIAEMYGKHEYDLKYLKKKVTPLPPALQALDKMPARE